MSPRPTIARSRLALLPAILSLSGCMVGPDFLSPKPPVADRYLQSGDRAVRSDRQDYENWWLSFNDPVLTRLIRIAYDQNLTLQAAGVRVLEARAALGVAIGEIYPQQQQIGGTLAYQQLSQSDPSSSGVQIPGQQTTIRRPSFDFWRASLTAQIAWELDFWGKFRRSVEAADSAYLSSIANYDAALVTLLGDVASTYIGVRTLQEQIKIARENVARQRKALAIARDRFKGGVATALDVYQAENVLGATEAAIPQLTGQMQQGLNALRLLLGMTPQSLDELLSGASGIPVPAKEVAVGIPADLVRRRPDIRAAELRAAAQSAQIGVAEADLYPAFGLTGSFGTLGSTFGRGSLDNVFSSKGIAFSFGPAFQWSILNYGQITNTVRVQDARLQVLLIDYQNAVLKAQKEVEDGLATYLQSRDAVVYLKKSVTAAAKAMDIAILQYQVGTRDFTTVLTAERNLFDAQNNLVVTSGNVSIGLVGVYRALGGGWQLREGSDLVPAATREAMRARTNWGRLLPEGPNQPPVPALPTPADRGPTIRAPEW